MIFLAVLTFTALVVRAPSVAAQGVTGSAVEGMVVTGAGTTLGGVRLELRNPTTGEVFSTVTDGSGRFFLDNVPPGGPYVLTASASGYEPGVVPDVVTTLGARFEVDVVLISLEEKTEEIVVTGRASRVLNNRGRTGASHRVSGTAISQLPLQGRNFTDLISTSPQVSGTSVAGQNNRYNNIQIDGGANNDLFGLSGSGTPGGQANSKALSVEAIKEFVVQVAPFDVRQGSFAGGLVNAITKSGTNELSGSVFGYFQNKALAGFGDDPTFLGYQTFQLGGSLGGPIIEDKAHFFVAADVQQHQSAFGNQFQLGGVDPAADAARAGFTTAEADRFAAILADKYGITDSGNALAPELGNPDYNLFAKVTTSVLPNSRLEVSYNFVNAEQDELTRAPTGARVSASRPSLRGGYQLSNSGHTQKNMTHTGRVKLTSLWDDGRISNEFLAGFSVIRDDRTPNQRRPLILVTAGELGTRDAVLAAGGERFSHQNELDQDIFQVQDNLTIGLGQHRVTVGTSNEFFRIRNLFLQAAYGAWGFDSLDAFEAGTPIVYQRRIGGSDLQEPGTAAFDVAQLGAYVQDEWTPIRDVTLTAGLRLDIPYLSSAPTNPTLANNPEFPIDTGRVPSGNPLFSPRVGFNWDVGGNATTIVRGGGGIFTGRPPYVWVSNAYTVNGLSQVEFTCSGASLPAFTVDPDNQPSECVGGNMVAMNVGEVDYFDPDTRYPQNGRLALGADQRLPFDMIGSLDLMYTQDVNGWYVTDENLVDAGMFSGEGRPLYGTFDPDGDSNPARKDTDTLRQAVRVSNKNGGRVYTATAQVQKRIGRDIDVSAGYTFSDSRDLMSLTSSQAMSNLRFAPLDGSLFDRNLRRSAFDRPHKITLTGTARLPYNFGAGLMYIGQSGTPYTYLVNGDVNADGMDNDTVYVPRDASDILLADPTQWDALNAFIASQECLRENRGRILPRGACRNPWQHFLNARFSYSVPTVAGQRLEVQWDIFNVLNLINNDWGLYKQAAQFENHSGEFLEAVGYNAELNKPVYEFQAPSQVTSVVYSPTLSRWRMQIGARYTF